MNRQQLIDLGNLYIKQEGTVPRAKKFSKNTGYCSRDLIYKEFGNWGSFLKELGVDQKLIDINRTKTKEEVISFIKEYVETTGKIPLSDDIRKAFSASTVINYGGAISLIKEAGFESINKSPYTFNGEHFMNLFSNWCLEENRLLTSREFEQRANVARSTIAEHFGSWNEFVEEAGYTPDYNNGWGVRTKGRDNNLYRSKAEAYFCDIYLFEKYDYQIEVRYPDKRKKYDWYIPSLNLYIELDGGIRPEVTKDKISINKELNRTLWVIPIVDIYNKSSLMYFEKFGV
jgi:hypothetical protein